MKQRIAIAGALAAGAVLYAGAASATDAMRFPDNGTEQMARGGAWVARASNPLATLYNPAALSTQASGVLLDVNGVFFKECYTREGSGSTVAVGTGTPKYPPGVCNDNRNVPQPLPSLAAAWRVTDKLGIGLSISPPSLYGHTSFPDTVPITYLSPAGRTISTQVATPQRYMLLSLGGIVLNQTLSAGYSITDRLHVGAGFIWGVGSLTVTNATMSVASDPNQEDPTKDVWAQVHVSDWFIPGFVVGALYSPIDQLDLGLSVTAQEAFDAHGDISLKANYWDSKGVSNSPVVTESSDIQKGLAHFRLPNPFDVRLGARFHMPRKGGKVMISGGKSVRDPLVDDVFDVEVDGSYTRNSAYQSVYLRFPQSPDITVKGIGGIVPKNADVPLNLKGDTVGIRVGGDYVVLPGKLAVRAGGWFEPSTQRPEDLNVTVVASQRIGVAGGLTYRLGKFDLEGGYMHVFFETQDNGGNGRIRALSGAATTNYRSPYAVNGGKLTASANIVSLGATMRF